MWNLLLPVLALAQATAPSFPIPSIPGTGPTQPIIPSTPAPVAPPVTVPTLGTTAATGTPAITGSFGNTISGFDNTAGTNAFGVQIRQSLSSAFPDTTTPNVIVGSDGNVVLNGTVQSQSQLNEIVSRVSG